MQCQFFEMFSIFQMMFIKEVILIQWEFCMTYPLPCWTTWSSRSIYLSKTKIIIGNLPLFYWKILYKNSWIEFAPQRCFILLFSVCVVGDSIYHEVTRYTLKWWSKKIPSKYRFIGYRLNLSHISVHSHYLLPFDTNHSIKTFLILSKALKM